MGSLSNGYKEGQKISKGTIITLADNKKRLIKNNIIVHLDDEDSIAMPDIKDKGSLKIVTYIPDDEVATLAERQKVRFQVKNKQGVLTILNGKVISLGTYPVQQKGMNAFKVDILIKTTKSEREFLRYGMQGKVTIITGKTNYLSLIHI